jgi:hypothetical protein
MVSAREVAVAEAHERMLSVEREAIRLGVPRQMLPALPLHPLVQVAWADGRVDPSESRVVLDAGREHGLGEEALAVLSRWLEAPPDAQTQAALDTLLRRIYHALPLPERRLASRNLVGLAASVARASGGFAGFGAVSDVEAEALEAIARTLGIAGGRGEAAVEDGPLDAYRELETDLDDYAFVSPLHADGLLGRPAAGPGARRWDRLERLLPWAETCLLGPGVTRPDRPRALLDHLRECFVRLAPVERAELGLTEARLAEQQPWAVVRLVCRLLADAAHHRSDAFGRLREDAALEDADALPVPVSHGPATVDALAAALSRGEDLAIEGRDYARLVAAYFRAFRLTATGGACNGVYVIPIAGRPDLHVPVRHVWCWYVDVPRRLIVPFDLTSADLLYDRGQSATVFNPLFDATDLPASSALLALVLAGWYAPPAVRFATERLRARPSRAAARLLFRAGLHGSLDEDERGHLASHLAPALPDLEDAAVAAALEAAGFEGRPPSASLPEAARGEPPPCRALGALEAAGLLDERDLGPEARHRLARHHVAALDACVQAHDADGIAHHRRRLADLEAVGIRVRRWLDAGAPD